MPFLNCYCRIYLLDKLGFFKELSAGAAAGGYDYYNQQQAPQTQPPGGTVAAANGSGYGINC